MSDTDFLSLRHHEYSTIWKIFQFIFRNLHQELLDNLRHEIIMVKKSLKTLQSRQNKNKLHYLFLGLASIAIICPLVCRVKCVPHFSTFLQKFQNSFGRYAQENPAPAQLRDLDFSFVFSLQSACGRILPSTENVTTRMGMCFPLASTACRAAYSSPPQHGTSMRVSVTLRTSFSVRIAVSFSA